MKIGAFTLKSMSDADLETLYLSAQAERIRRADNKRKRATWVNEYFTKFINTYNVHYIISGETTVVAVYDALDGMRMGKATPVSGDVFNDKVGIAVAFAKAIGHEVPDFV
jgi:hypothetical protein